MERVLIHFIRAIRGPLFPVLRVLRGPIPLCLGLLLAPSGCARHYVIKLTNGGQITTSSKPRLKGASYYFKDAKGQVHGISAGRVVEIMPASMAKEETPMFKPETR